MVVAAFPVLKIGLLLMKQFSKPLANLIKNEAKRSPRIRKYIIVPTGRVLINLENKTIKQVKGVKPEPISEDDVVETGSNALGEIILFTMLTILLLAEYNRQGDKKALKEKSKEEEMFNLQETIVDLLAEVDKLKQSVANLKKQIRMGSDVMELEEFLHSEVHDSHFFEVFGKKKHLKDNVDLSSPSM